MSPFIEPNIFFSEEEIKTLTWKPNFSHNPGLTSWGFWIPFHQCLGQWLDDCNLFYVHPIFPWIKKSCQMIIIVNDCVKIYCQFFYLFKFNRLYLFCVKFAFPDQKVHTYVSMCKDLSMIFLVKLDVIWQIFFIHKLNVNFDFPD